MKTTIVKSHNHTEPYDDRKFMASIYAACLSVHTPSGEAEITAKQIAKTLQQWLVDKPEVTSYDIRIKTTNLLHTYNPNAAYMYKHHGKIH